MGIIKVEDVAFVRFRAPDLARMKTFVQDFGFVVAGETDNHLYARGAGTEPFVHHTTLGEAGFAGVGFRAAGYEDLERLASTDNAKIETLSEPGGGSVVRLRDPDGFLVEVVADRQPSPALPLPPRDSINSAQARLRTNKLKRVGAGPAHVLRLGHCVLNVSDFRASERWYKDRFGFVTSDEIALAPDFSVGAFLRCDRGDQPTDHHTLFLIQGPSPRFNHAAFEVQDMDDVMSGHDHLKAAGYEHEWGIGRHILGSQIFDYWRDPWGHTVEHWTDGDLLSLQSGEAKASLEDLLGVQWGPMAPPTMG